MISVAKELIGATGRRYTCMQLIQQRPHVGSLWLATSGNDRFVLKNVPESIFSNFTQDIRPRLLESPFTRSPWDLIPNQYTLVYKYLDNDLLNLARRKLSMSATKRILRDALEGLAQLHDRDIVHLDMKADNIMVNYHAGPSGLCIDNTQIIDLENAGYLPNGRCIKRMLPGNENWRSPEGHLKGSLTKATDMFSFGAVCVYAVIGHVIFGSDEDLRKHEAAGALPPLIRLQRQVSYFGDEMGFQGLKRLMKDDEVSSQVLQMLWDDRHEENIPYRPFAEWANVQDEGFIDVIGRLMSLDPAQRLTARGALKHPWFAAGTDANNSL